ncbi:hypothetical protein BCR33DRAFT_789751 [Rhizoclosmatium globosum]|uniref:L domain-like protein n=1 Tax=Rhizoclosmatium globosum TaxID=329046 RepID=A0A1Y2BS76_9FUNG|nr:hypothetical protein BCR33DRAFT_789751 [Rhizoclosmatium globosum]|eukprot:ORY37487.1 hypothetical protein BCR33DRAFT_789751 [Rhizoclosmatium globosum]
MSGSIPTLPSTLTDLKLYINAFTGTIPLLPQSLGYLNLGGNLLSGTIPYLPKNLYYIDLSNNNLNGSIPQSILKSTYVYLDANCINNANDFNFTNICPSADVLQGGLSISALTDSEYVDKALAYKEPLALSCFSECQNNIPAFSDVATFNSTCLDIEANPNAMNPLKVEIFIKILKMLCKQFLQPVPSTKVTNNTISFNLDDKSVGLLGFQAFVSTANGTYIAGSKFEINEKPLNIPLNASRKRDSLESQTISIPCGSNAKILHKKYIIDDSSILLSDPNKLGHVKQEVLNLAESASGCQDESGPIVTTMATLPTKTTAVAVPIVSTADVIPPPPATTAIIVPAVTTAVPPVVLTTTTTTTNVAPLVETSSVFVPPILQVDNSGSGGSNSALTNSGNQGGAADNNNNGDNGVGSGTGGADNTVGSSQGNSGKSGNSNMAATMSLVNNFETPKPVKSVTSFAVSPQQSLAPLPNPGFLQVTGAKAQTIVSSVLSISASFGPVDATELQNSLVYVDAAITPGAALVTVAAPVFPKTTGGMNKIVLSVDSYSFKFTSSGQVQAYNEASSSGSHTMSAAQGTTATIVLVLPDLVTSVLYGFELNSLSDTFVISVLKADELATPLAKVSYSVQAQGTKRDGGKITVVMGVAKVRAQVTASAVTTVVAPAKTIGSVDAQVLITSGADFKFKMALQLLWLIL